MNKSTVTGIIIGVVIATAGGVVANYAINNEPKGAETAEAGNGDAGGVLDDLLSFGGPKYAEVVSVTPVVEAESVPREVCEQYEVTERAPVKDEKKITGTVAGAVIGGVLGNQVGGGSGKKIATVAGAVAGGVAGNKVQEDMQNRNTTTRLETRCDTVYDTNEVTRGYDVAYRLGSEQQTIRVNSDPGYRAGDRIPVEDGELQIQ